MAADDYFYRRRHMKISSSRAKRLHGHDGTGRKVFDAIYDLLKATKRMQDQAVKAREHEANLSGPSV